ncbi:MAG: hypothetical protein R6V07_13615, partial [Armatimonadota bacterium]
MSDVFLLGAGFSRALSRDMPLLRQLGRQAIDRLADERTFGSRSKRHAPMVERMLRRMNGDIEQVLSYLANAAPWQTEAATLEERAAFIDMQRAIAEVIESSERRALGALGQPWMKKLVSRWHVHRSPVLTLNYDTL